MKTKLAEKMDELKGFRWGLFLSLCALGLVPAVYQTIRTHWIAQSAPLAAFDILGQMEWFDLIDETLRAFLIVPLYSVLNRAHKAGKDAFSRCVFQTGATSLLLYFLFSVGVIVYGTALLRAMNADGTDLASAARYLRLETMGFVFGVAVSFAQVVFVVDGDEKNVWLFLLARTLLALAADRFLIPAFGIYGVAGSDIAVNLILAAVCFALLSRKGLLKICGRSKADRAEWKQWRKTGLYSGMQQFIDNLVYAVMVCKMVNLVQEQGNYWIANNFIWGWLLIPITALAEIVKRDCAKGYENLRLVRYYFVLAATVILWVATIPLWTPFYRYAENLSNAGAVFRITILLAPFYVFYAGSAIVDAIFIGLGKTKYCAVNSMIVNFGYYGIFYALYRLGAVTFTMNVIVLMFGFGMVVHWIVSRIQQKFFLPASLTAAGRRDIRTACSRTRGGRRG